MAKSISFDINARDRASAELIKVGQNVEQVERKIESLNRRGVEVDVDIATTERKLALLRRELQDATGDKRVQVEADVAAAERELRRLSATRLKIDMDTAEAQAQLAELSAHVDRLDGRNINLQVDVDTTRAMGRIAAVGLALGALSPAVGLLGMGLLGMGLAGAAGAGVLAGSLYGVQDAVTALGEKDTSVASSMKSNASAVKDAIQGVRDAQERVRDAEERYADTVRSSERAQRDLNDARREAADRLDDLEARTKRMRLSEVDAALSVEEAEKRLNDLRIDPKSTSLERRRASLRVAEAKAHQEELAKQAKDLAAEKADADKKGIEGSDVVQDALERQAEAARNVARAQRDIERAQEGVVRAQERVREASQKAGTAATQSVNKVRDAMAGLTPEGQRFARFLRFLIDGPIKDLRDAGQRNLLPGLETGIRGMLPFADSITRSFGTIAKNLGDMFAMLGPHIGAAADQLMRIAAVASNRAFKDLGEFIAYLLDQFTIWAKGQTTDSIMSGLDRFEGVLRKVWGGLGLVARGFQWLFDHSTDMMIVSGSILAIRGAMVGIQAIAAVGPWGLLAVGIVALGAGLVLLYRNSESFRQVVDKVWTSLKGGFEVIRTMVEPKLKALAKTFNDELRPAMGEFVQAMGPVVTFVTTTLAPVVGWAFGQVIDMVRGATRMIAGILNVFTGLLRGDWTKAWNGIRQIVSGAWEIIKNTTIAQALSWIWNRVTGWLGDLKKGIGDGWTSIRTRINTAWEAIKSLLSTGWTWIRVNVFDRMSAGVKALGTAFSTGSDLIGKAWDKVKEKAAAPIRFVINTVLGGVGSKFNEIADKVGVGMRLPVPRAGFARGGPISGPGSGTSDDVDIKASAGEWIIRAAAAQRLGPRFMTAVNNADRYDISGDTGFGVVKPRFAAGGQIAPSIASRVSPVRAWIPSVDPLPYIWGGVGPGGYDCSGLVGEVWARLTGRQSYRRYMTTNTILDSPGALGLAPGPGLFTIGVSRSHTAGNLAGLAFEAASSRSGIKVGSSAKSVTSFPSVFHLATLGTAGFSNAGGGGGGGFSWNPLDWAKSLASKAISTVSNTWWGTLDKMGAFGALGTGIGKKLISSVFDVGGVLQPGLTLAYNGTGRPERVLSALETERYARVNPGAVGGGTGVTYNITVPVSNAVVGSEQQVAKVITGVLNSAVRSGTLRLPSK